MLVKIGGHNHKAHLSDYQHGNIGSCGHRDIFVAFATLAKHIKLIISILAPMIVATEFHETTTSEFYYLCTINFYLLMIFNIVHN